MGISPLRVALVTRSLATGGAERHVVKLCQAVPRSEVALCVFLLVNDEPPDLLPDLPSDIPVLVSPFRRHRPQVLKWLADGMCSQQIQVAQSFLWIPDAYTSLSKAMFMDIPLICSERGDRSYVYSNPLRNLYDRLVTFRVADWVCANSNFGQRLLVQSGCKSQKVSVIHNGVDLAQVDSIAPTNVRQMLGLPQDSYLVGMVSRLISLKGVDTFIRAVALIESKPMTFGVIVGDGPQRTELEQLACSLNANQRIRFLGKVLPAEPIIKDLDIAVLATKSTEHCSNSILEYMACGRPVIASNVGGNPELVIANETGLLVEPGDPFALARAIQQLTTNPVMARQMGSQGRARVESEFRMETVTTRFIDMWREVATGKGKGIRFSTR